MSILLLSVASLSIGQNAEIAYSNLSLYDETRARTIDVTMYYPAKEAGLDKEVEEGIFHVISFGHGFVIPIDTYQNLVDYLVPNGLVVLMVDTENTFSPDHEAFALDLAFALNEVRLWAADEGSIFYEKLSKDGILMGHSMGGGAAVLASEHVADLLLITTFAPAETDPSAVFSNNNGFSHYLMFTGLEDQVTPAEDHADLFHEYVIPTECISRIDIIGGGHCFFANESFTCDLGEAAAGSDISITRAEQHEVVYDYLMPFIQFLRGEVNLKDDIIEGGLVDDRIQFFADCIWLYTENTFIHELQVFPNPANEFIQFDINFEQIKISNAQGECVLNHDFGGSSMDVSSLSDGQYFLEANYQDMFYRGRFVKFNE